MLELLKKGNKSSLIASIVNLFIAGIRGGAWFVTGNTAMFAEFMHALADSANQGFVYIGTALSKKPPTPRFPNGFGRVVHLVCLAAVLVVAIMSYETVKEGVHHLLHPTESGGLFLLLTVFIVGVILEFFVLYKAMNYVLKEAGVEKTGFQVIFLSFKHLKKASPATRLVFMEDLVASCGGLLAIIAVLTSHFTPFKQAEGVASVIIGLSMFYVVSRVFMDNVTGAIGESDPEMEARIGELVMQDSSVKDVQKIVVIREGEELHVELEVEVDPSLSIAQADDIKDRLETKILTHESVTDVIIAFDETDKVNHWAKKKGQLEKKK
ncbi:cation diffusion facilitator family transporter [Alkalihalobacillus deserti]|uniref:cation diffusion facilitator family transporter n=1 Tax=Alkalihalobacillus deserti TaxID=2879466 RepID=UPI001D13849E|nr:cation diffusion facilitator family transporter [Alkalihalobacillus deserti]